MGTNSNDGSNLDILPFTLHFDLTTGITGEKNATRRTLSNMRGMFADDRALEERIETGDSVVYEFYELGLPATPGDLLFGTSIVYPGKVGDEYFMTKGHFHTVLDTAEVYYCLSGQGYMLMENPEGEWNAQPMSPGSAVYVPKRYAHRSINTGMDKLVTFFVFRSDAGHDYGTIETKGYRKLIVERDGKPAILDNPKWK